MDDATARAVQAEAAEALLDRGISVPLKAFRLPFRRRPVVLRVTMRRPCLAGQIEFARIYLSMGVTSEELSVSGKEEQMRFLASHGAKISRMIACTLCVGPVRERFMRPVAWFLRHCVEPRYLLGAALRFAQLMGTGPFIPIIRLAERTNPLVPRLSRLAEGS
ncbi:hypothetical protein [Xylanibacter muris]|uniref:hypothetical protein n=1 Tax=Xylanibacter muris TaxID=2736290 RepID=UPI0025A12CA5|nr:hypothetical protein [Xylanibacter muris]